MPSPLISVSVALCREVHSKCLKKNIDGVVSPCDMVPILMPNQPDPDKIQVGIRMPRTLHRKLLNESKARGLSISDLIREILHRETHKIVLTSRDYAQISKDIKKAEDAQSQNR